MIAPDELPHTFAALQAGETSEWRATIVARETAWLSKDDRAEVDRIVAPRLGELGDRSAADETKKSAYTLDPHGYVDHLAKAEADRHVSVRPAPEAMSRVSALLPMTQGVAVGASLGRAADAAKATGDPRTRGQIMADTLVERCTGLASADAVGVEVQIVLPADGLFASTVGPTEDITDHTYCAAAHERAEDTETDNTRTDKTRTSKTRTSETRHQRNPSSAGDAYRRRDVVRARSGRTRSDRRRHRVGPRDGTAAGAVLPRRGAGSPCPAQTPAARPAR